MNQLPKVTVMTTRTIKSHTATVLAVMVTGGHEHHMFQITENDPEGHTRYVKREMYWDREGCQRMLRDWLCARPIKLIDGREWYTKEDYVLGEGRRA